jgi:hypothetical protein
MQALIVHPTDFSQQCREFLISLVFQKLLHPPDDLWRKTFVSNVAALDEVRELLDHRLAPVSLGDAVAYMLADISIHIDEFPVDGSKYVLAGALNDCNDIVKRACAPRTNLSSIFEAPQILAPVLRVLCCAATRYFSYYTRQDIFKLTLDILIFALTPSTKLPCFNVEINILNNIACACGMQRFIARQYIVRYTILPE